jgi:hypothetical protein
VLLITWYTKPKISVMVCSLSLLNPAPAAPHQSWLTSLLAFLFSVLLHRDRIITAIAGSCSFWRHRYQVLLLPLLPMLSTGAVAGPCSLHSCDQAVASSRLGLTADSGARLLHRRFFIADWSSSAASLSPPHELRLDRDLLCCLARSEPRWLRFQ